MKEAISGTIVDTAMGATFGAMGFEGTDALQKSNKMVKNAHKAIRDVTRKTVHPTVKANARVIFKQSRKYICREFKDSLIDNSLNAVLGKGISKISEIYYSRAVK